MGSEHSVHTHGHHDIRSFGKGLRAEREDADKKQIQIDGKPARIVLRSTILDTLDEYGTVRADKLAVFNLQLHGLDPSKAENVNIHAWALHDLMREKRIEKVTRDKRPHYRLKRADDEEIDWEAVEAIWKAAAQ